MLSLWPMLKRIKHFWNSLGPGLVTGIANNDSSAVLIYALAGARFGLAPLWVLLYILPFMIAIQSMCARIGALSGCGLAGNIRKYYSPWLLVPAVASIVVVNTINVGADISGMAGAINLLIPISSWIIAVLLAVFVVGMVIFLRYDMIEKIFKWLALTLLAYGVALILVEPNWGAILQNLLVPSIQNSKIFWLTMFAMVGTTLSQYMYFWQANHETEDLRNGYSPVRVCKFRPVSRSIISGIDLDTRVGMIASNVISVFILALTAHTIHLMGSGDIQTLRDAASALEPLAGPYAYPLFVFGMIGSGILAIPVLAGSAAYALSEMFGWRASIDVPFNRAPAFYTIMAASVAVGLIIPFVGITPVQALFWSGVLGGMATPFLIALVVHMARNKNIVGTNRVPIPLHILGVGAFLMMITGSLYVIFA